MKVLALILTSLLFLPGAQSPQDPPLDWTPVLAKKLPKFRGNVFPGFVELRTEDLKWVSGALLSPGHGHRPVLFNINSIISIEQWDPDMSNLCLIYVSHGEHPKGACAYLIRENYEDVVSKFRRAVPKP